MPDAQAVQYESLEKFRRNVSKAQIADLMAKMTGGKVDLLSYDEVAKRIKSRQQIEMGTQMIPLDKIVGSVGRYRDFTRTFLPRAGVSPERWARVDAVMNSLEGFPPIEVYKIGDVYFVRDGNHRVSVARANGLTHIEAYVTEIPTDVPLHMEDFERDQWIIKIERAEFLKETKLDEIRPGHGIEFTEPGRYQILLRHIQVHQYLRNLDLAREGSDHRLSWEEAVASWYDNVYLPVVEAIRRHRLLESFPSRTEADLYLWIAHHREQLAQRYGLAPLSPDAAVSTFAEVHSERPLEQAVRTLKFGLHKALGDLDKPLGMSDEEFAEARARYEAGERTLAEAEQQQAKQVSGADKTDVAGADASAADDVDVARSNAVRVTA
ncbi:hypothetical protein [Caldilinea sp.]|jgi:hypothetical protein|uniref:hypothetical protein n=1 Tax=Caldilinea sp. TaxID=2293560 RepID=UPI0021DF2EA6|nr:hypothetical protein [Caldilinea sp.]GIV71085.1 MAG: hypothetical protein KatS3mg048_3947 [Caldilinea sp.]